MSKNEMLKDAAYKSEELWVKSEKVDSLQMAIFQAIYKGDHNPDMYEWAFNALNDITYDLKNDLEKLMNDLFTLLRDDMINISGGGTLNG